MSNLGYRNNYKYYCQTEAKWIYEERAEGDPPTVCVNNASHTLNTGSISVTGKFTRVDQIIQSDKFDSCDLTKIDLLNVDQKCEALAQRVRVLETVLQKNGLIRFS
jgi:hypothetical protein